MAGFADHFSELAARYAAYRPHYPPALALALAGHAERHDVAWDVGCGNGQLSVALAAHFARVIATDPAQAQLDHAERDPRVEYRRVPAEASGLPDASCDLAVAAQAAHWFDWPRFVVEVGELLVAYYREIEPYWPAGRAHVNNGYRDLELPWPAVAVPPIEMTSAWTRDELAGYITTWSATARLVAARGEAPIDELRRRLAAVWPDDEPREVRWPLTIKLARR
jgi:SAM-dependent methyltransferase